MHLKTIPISLIALFLWSCDSSSKPEVKNAINAPLIRADDAIRFHDEQTIKNRQVNASAQETAGFVFELPEKWVELPPKTMRNINIGFEEEASAQCYLTILKGNGGGILDNINRWRGQLSQAPVEEKDIQNLPQVEILNQQGFLISIAGTLGEKTEDQLLAIILQTEKTFYSLKFTGPETFVTQQKNNFLAFAKSIKENVNKTDHQHAHSAEKEEQANTLTFETPEGWQSDSLNKMRYANFKWPEMGDTQCYITLLPLINDVVKMNINRWRDQMGQAPLTQQEETDLEIIKTAIGDCTYVDILQKDQAENPSRILGGIIITKENSIFIKMVGSSKFIEPQKEHFKSIIQSLNKKDAP